MTHRKDVKPPRPKRWEDLAGASPRVSPEGNALPEPGCMARPSDAATTYDLVVYGGTPAGIASAVQAARMGKSVLLIEPSRHIGGILSGGMSTFELSEGAMWQAARAAFGGVAREFSHRLGLHYAADAAWVHERRCDFPAAARDWESENLWWEFEPHVAEAVFNDMVREAKVFVVCGERLDLNRGVQKNGPRILAITMESGRSFRGRMYIDATYEGDLMAKAGVSYAIGRESNAQYGETRNGVQAGLFYPYHQFTVPVDPYRKPGDPSSGLLPGVHGGPPGRDGEGDHRVQAYCLRMCLTDVEDNKAPIERPDDYDPLRYELLLRYFEAGFDKLPLSIGRRPNRKSDTNNVFAFSTDYIGMNYDYPDASHATRDKILLDHLSYQQGLMWTLANHPRVPERIRKEARRWGPAKDEFVDNGNWPHQLYVREARRMQSDYVMTENNCLGRQTAPDSIGMATFPIDSHNTQRYVDEQGHARNEGNVQTSGLHCDGNVIFPPYPISYRSIAPKADQCSNLLVPICLSASHVGFCAIRLEPTLMILGQSAAVAACLAIDLGQDVQQLDYAMLRRRLLSEGQVLE